MWVWAILNLLFCVLAIGKDWAGFAGMLGAVGGGCLTLALAEANGWRKVR